ncbi:hypothetical protein [Parvularcula sp. LCG005]|uniref:hypothetical protein n=1 Tax=Parvularcula sp. LCG005 TaxID=3078805 RepID=UPI0029434D50|nr:hypothetical protein [Parvularcula sp. LCG005]WOI51977.1 hypothetical protein RUI03_07385 [Parvularcula sp. LCG005]
MGKIVFEAGKWVLTGVGVWVAGRFVKDAGEGLEAAGDGVEAVGEGAAKAANGIGNAVAISLAAFVAYKVLTK